MAHELQPVVRVGHQGDTESVRNALDEALEAHELVKIRFLEAKEERRRISSEMAENLDAQVVDVTGNVALLYRPCPNPEKRQYCLP